MPNAIIFDIEATDKDNPVLIEAAWVALDSISPFTLGEEFHQYELDKDFTTSQFSAEFGSDAEFPQVAIGYKHIGSIKETLQYLKTKEVL